MALCRLPISHIQHSGCIEQLEAAGLFSTSWPFARKLGSRSHYDGRVEDVSLLHFPVGVF